MPHHALLAAAALGCAALAAAHEPASADASTVGGPGAGVAVRQRPSGGDRVVVIAAAVRDSMNAVFARSTRDWRRYPNTVNPINYGAGSAGWREALRCLRGRAERDTVWVWGWEAARGTRALASAVTGDCGGVAELVGTWHTHPWRADSAGRPVKVPGLSAGDLRTFGAGRDAVALVQWSDDSLDAAVRGTDRRPRYPAPIAFGGVVAR